MKNRNIIVAAAIVALAGLAGYGLYRIGMHQGMESVAAPSNAGTMPKVGETDKKVLYWHDPMVPGQKFDKPGKSPFMDMQLVPVYADGTDDEGSVKISPRVQQNLGIRTAEVAKENITSTFETVGNVAFNERDVALVQARSNGFIEKLYVRATLDPVRKGQPLAQLYVPDWIAAQEEYLTVKRMQGSGTAMLLDGARQRMRLAGMTEEQIRLVESSSKIHPRLTLLSPISGVVSELAAREGMTVASGAPLFKINGLKTVWVNADVPENAAEKVRPGNAVEARSPALPGVVLKGKVSAILPEINPSTRTLKARVELANPDGQLVPGMFASINFSAAAKNAVLTVPSEAVIQTGTRSVVIVDQGDGKFAPVNVETGPETNRKTVILKGLEAGQKVVVSGQFLIDSEASLRGTTTRMSAMPAAEAAKAAGDASGPVHRGEGKVESISKDEIMISHGPIPSLQWGPMTMGFKPPASGMPKNVALGDTVVFEIRAAKDGTFEIVTIAPTAAAPKQDPGGSAADETPKNNGNAAKSGAAK